MEELIKLIDEYAEFKGQDFTEPEWELMEEINRIHRNKEQIKLKKISDDMTEEEFDNRKIFKQLKSCKTDKDYKKFFEDNFCEINYMRGIDGTDNEYEMNI